MQLEVREGRDVHDSLVILESRSGQRRIIQIDAEGRGIPDLEIPGRIIGVGLRIDPSVTRQRQRGNVTDPAADGPEGLLALPDRVFDIAFPGDHPSGDPHCGLEEGGRRDIGPGNLVRSPVPVGVDILPKPLGGLDPVVMIKRVIGELTDRDHVARLVKRPQDEVGRMKSAGRCQGRRGQPLNVGCIPRPIRIPFKRAEGEPFAREGFRVARR